MTVSCAGRSGKNWFNVPSSDATLTVDFGAWQVSTDVNR
jgi:hypothetical protein